MAHLTNNASPVPLDDATLVGLVEFACELADAAGAAIKPHFRAPLEVENKTTKGPGYDPVTAADREAEVAIRRLIRARHPDHGIFGEELGHARSDSGLTWVVDPIDGTRAFITGSLAWGTLIGLHDGRRSVLGVMDQPVTGERFIGSRFGAELRTAAGRRRLATRRCLRLADAVLCSTHPELFPVALEEAAFRLLTRRVRLVRYGGDCYNYAMLAHGLVDLVVEGGMAPYDIQALVPLIEAAGGVVTSWTGGPAGDGGQVLAAGDPNIHAEVLVLLRHALG